MQERNALIRRKKAAVYYLPLLQVTCYSLKRAMSLEGTIQPLRDYVEEKYLARLYSLMSAIVARDKTLH